jgi:hypothetical protein
VVPNRRARGIAVVIEGFFAFVWFGWGQAAAPSWLSIPLGVGSAAGALVAVAGAVMAVRAKGERTPMRDPDVRRRYFVLVGLEFGLIGLGAVALALAGQSDWITVWVCFGVGVHFVPLAGVLGMRELVPVGVLITMVSVAALVTGLLTDVAPSTVTGPGAGLCLLSVAVLTALNGRAAADSALAASAR